MRKNESQSGEFALTGLRTLWRIRQELNPTGMIPPWVHALRPIAERGFRVLRVIYNETDNPVAIVTAYFDDEVKDL
jgi:hypothetical protein